MLAPASLPPPRANALMAERLMSNLNDNALKHGKPPVTLRMSSTADKVWIDVEDAGTGLPPRAPHALQEAFTRGDGSPSADQPIRRSQSDWLQPGLRLSMKACTPSSAVSSIMLQAIVLPASS